MGNLLPFLAKGAMVNQGHQHLAVAGGEKFRAVELAPQQRFAIDGLQQGGHGIHHGAGANGEVTDRAGFVVTRGSHGIEAAFSLMPDAKFCPHAEVQGRRCKDLNRWHGQPGKSLVQGVELGVQLSLIVFRVDHVHGSFAPKGRNYSHTQR